MKDFIGLGNETPEEILQLLQANADSTDTMQYTRFFTDDELAEKNELFLNQSIQYAQLSDKLQEVKKEFKGKMDPLALQNRVLLTQLKDKGESVKGEVYIIIDQENKEVNTYSPEGKLINSRPIRKGEVRQPGLFQLPKAESFTIKPDKDAKTGTDDFSFDDQKPL